MSVGRLVVGWSWAIALAACGPPATVTYGPTPAPQAAPVPPAAPAPTPDARAAEPDSCRGVLLSFEQAKKLCRVEAGEVAPAKDALVFHADPLTAKSGEHAATNVYIRNVTGARLALTIRPYAIFDAQVLAGDNRIDEEFEEPALGGLIGCIKGLDDCRQIRVVLEPDGVLVARVAVPTRVTRYVHQPPSERGVLKAMKPTDAGPIPPGQYRAVILLPWSDKNDDESWTPRSVELPVQLTP